MKKFLSLLLAAMLVMSMAACGTDTPASDDTPAGDDEVSEVTSVRILLPHIGDQSYMDVTANAAKLLAAKYGDAMDVQVVEMGDDEADWEPANMQAADEGHDIIISGNWQYEGANSLDNVYAITYAAHEIGYLTGVVAGVKSQTGIIGGVVGQNNAGMNQFMAGYIQGAADANPEIKVIITYVGSYTDPATAKEQTIGMLNAGADIVWGCAGGSGGATG